MGNTTERKGYHARWWFKRVDSCPNESKHVYGPAGYVAWHRWAEEHGKTHKQEKCPGCGLYLIWNRKEQGVKEKADG